MKKFLLLIGMIAIFLPIYAQTFNASPSPVASGGTLTITGSGETNSNYFSWTLPDPTLITYSDGIQRNWVTIGPVTDQTFYNIATHTPTNFKIKIYNGSNQSYTVTIGVKTNINSSTPGTSPQTNITKYFTVTVNPTPIVTTFNNDAKSASFQKQNCPAGTKGSTVTYSVPKGKYTADTQAAANQFALDEIAANGQNYANSTGQCITLYYNTEQSALFSKNNCTGNVISGPAVPFTIPANTYSAESQTQADQLAINALNNQGQENANNMGTCVQYTHFFKLVTSNIVNDPDPSVAYKTADFDIYVFSDAACTIPLPVPSSSLTVNYQKITHTSTVGNPNGTTVTQNLVATIHQGATNVSLGTIVTNDCPSVPYENLTLKKANSSQRIPIGGNYPCINRVVRLSNN